MDKEKVVMAMLEKINNDTRAMGVANGVDLMAIEQQVMQNQNSLIYMLSNLHDFIIEKGLFKDPSWLWKSLILQLVSISRSIRAPDTCTKVQQVPIGSASGWDFCLSRGIIEEWLGNK